MPTYNGERYLAAQMDTILPQLGDQDEVVVQDDCSSDATLDILDGYRDPRIKVDRNSANMTVMRTVERALGRARGDFIFLADQDDVWLSGRVDKALELMRSHDLVVVNCRVVDEDLRIVEEDFFEFAGSGSGFFKNLYRNTFLGCCMSFRRTLLERALPFPHPIPMHDMWLGLVATVWGRVHFCPAPLLLYRRHSAAATSTATNRPARPLVVKLADRVQLAAGLAGRAASTCFGKSRGGSRN